MFNPGWLAGCRRAWRELWRRWIPQGVLGVLLTSSLGIEALGAWHLIGSRTGVLGLWVVTMAILLPLMTVAVPLFRGAEMTERGEEVFRLFQGVPGRIHRMGVFLIESLPTIMALVLSAIMVGVWIGATGQPLKPWLVVVATSILFSLSLSVLGWIGSLWVENRLQALALLFLVWVVVVFLYDLGLMLAVLVGVPETSVQVAMCLNPVDLFRLTVYVVHPSLAPPVQSIPPLLWIASGWLMWVAVFPFLLLYWAGSCR